MKKTLITLLMVLLCAMLIISCANEPKVYEVTFDLNGGSGTVEPQSVEEGAKATAPTTKPTSSDKYLTFVCWSADGTTEFKFAETAITSDITLKALWRDYKVGDDGPAGGIIFYDCDDDNNTENDGAGPDGLKSSVCGWRYLEAAKNDLAGRYMWYSSGGNASYGATGTAIGTGKENTNKIKNSGIDGFPAAKACVEYNGGGETDWFLPSKDELVLVFKNLANLSTFVNNSSYWSSSEAGNGQSYRPGSSGGAVTSDSYNVPYYVRPVRSF